MTEERQTTEAKSSLKRKPWWRRIIRGTIVAIGFLVFALLSFIVWALGTNVGLTVLLYRGLEFYNDMIPGSIHVAEVRGTIVDDFELIGVQGKTEQGEQLFHCRCITFSWWPVLLPTGDIFVERIKLYHSTVTLYPERAGAGFLDLAPRSDPNAPPPPPEPEKEPMTSFSLPLPIRLMQFELEHVALRQVKKQRLESLVNLGSFRLQANSRGEEIQGILKLRALNAPVAQAYVNSLRFEAHWRRDTLRLRDFKLVSNLANVTIADSLFNPFTIDGRADLTARIPEKTLTRYTGLKLGSNTTLRLIADGGLSGLDIQLDAELPPAILELSGEAALKPTSSAKVKAHIHNLDFKRFQLPVDGVANLQIEADVKGTDIDSLQANATVQCLDCKVEKLGKIELRAITSMVQRTVKADVTTSARDLAVKVDATLDNFQALAAKLSLQAPDLRSITSLFLADPLSGALSLNAACNGDLPFPDCSGSGELKKLALADISLKQATLSFSSQMQNQTLHFDSDLHATELSAKPVILSSIDLQATGSPEQIETKLALDAASDGKGRVSLSLRPGPPLRVTLHSLTGNLREIPLKLEEPSRIEVNSSRIAVTKFRLGVDSGEIKIDGYFDPNLRNRLSVKLQELDLLNLAKFVEEPILQGRLTAEFSLDGASSQPQADVQILIADTQVDDQQLGNLSVQAGYRNRRSDLSLYLERGERRLFEIQASAPLAMDLHRNHFDWLKNQNHSLNLTVNEIGVQDVEEWVEIPEELDFSYSLTAQAQGNISEYQADVNLTGWTAHQQLEPVPMTVRLSANEATQQVSIQSDPSSPLPLTIEGQSEIDLASVMEGHFDPASTPLTASVDIRELDLKPFNPFLPAGVHDLRGMFSTHLLIDGTVDNPHPKGFVALNKGEMSLLNILTPFRNIGLKLDIDDTRADLQTLSVTSGKGKLELKGWAEIGDGESIAAELQAQMNDFQIELPGAPQSFVDGRVAVNASGDKDKIRIDIGLRDMLVDVYTTFTKAPKDAPLNPNVVFVDEEGLKQQMKQPLNQDSPEIIAELTLETPLIIKGDFMDMEWGGGISVHLLGGNTSVNGQFELVRGRYEFLGNSFKVDEALLSFPPGTSNEPFLNLAANASMPDAEVLMMIKGRTSAPKLTFRSQPPMPEYQIFTLLVTGNLETNEESQDEVQGKAANLGSGLIAYQFPQLQQQLKRRLGIDRVGVSFGETADQPILTVGKRITRRIYVESAYHHNAPDDVNRTQGKVEIQLVPRWTLETFYGDANIGGIDVFWHMPFPVGTQPPLPETPQTEQAPDDETQNTP